MLGAANRTTIKSTKLGDLVNAALAGKGCPHVRLQPVLASASFWAAAPALSSASASTPDTQKPRSAASAATSSFPADLSLKGYHAAYTNEIMEFDVPTFELNQSEFFDGSLDVHEDDDLENRAGVVLGSLAAEREKLKEKMFAQIVHFRDNRRNGIRKFEKLKRAFQATYLKITCTDKVDASALKKKCGRIWACIEYAILEFVDISSFDCSHVERMQVKHKEYLLSRMCKRDGSEVEVNTMQKLGLLLLPIDYQAPLAALPDISLLDLPDKLPLRRSERDKKKPTQPFLEKKV
jgi:hypothetical protein